jgi:glutamate racemase
MSNSYPIGVFDSGLGGTSIWREVNALLPNEDTIYLSDSKNAPYGEKSPESILNLCIKNTELLIRKDCKLIIVACNTATTNTIEYLRNNYKVPFIGIEPAIKPAALKTKTNCVGILATKGTLSSSLFSKTSEKFTSNIKVIERVGTGLVALIETGKMYSKEMTLLLENYLNPMLEDNIDYLVLGCTHYPYLIPQIKKIIGNNVTIIDSGLAVAKQTKNILDRLQLLNLDTSIPKHSFYTNTNVDLLINILSRSEFDGSVALLEF